MPALVIKMLPSVAKTDICVNFACYLDKIKISYDQSFRYSKQKNHRHDEK